MLRPVQVRSDELASPLVLVVDDEPAIVRLIAVFLKDSDFRVALHDSAEAAIDFLEITQELPALAIVDIQLPGISGLEFATYLKDHGSYSSIAILLISAFSEPKNHRGDGFLAKPFASEALISNSTRLLDGRLDK